ncbi:hypothetical protein RI065_03045 [Mycoplasmatota bacterium zrk1]
MTYKENIESGDNPNLIDDNCLVRPYVIKEIDNWASCNEYM